MFSSFSLINVNCQLHAIKFEALNITAAVVANQWTFNNGCKASNKYSDSAFGNKHRDAMFLGLHIYMCEVAHTRLNFSQESAKALC